MNGPIRQIGKAGRHWLFLALASLTLVALTGCSSGPSPSAYTVRGRVTIATAPGGQPAGLDGVTIAATGGYTGAERTDQDGRWSMSGLRGTVTITPAKNGYTFSPMSTIVSSARDDVDFTASREDVSYAVSGRVLDCRGEGIPGVHIDLDGGYGMVTTGTGGAWSISGLQGRVTATPRAGSFKVYPANLAFTEASHDADFRYGYTVSGKVVDYGGKPLQNMGIWVNGSHCGAWSDEKGEWTQHYLWGHAVVTATHNAWTFEPGRYEVDGPSANLRFVGKYSLSGRVVDGRGWGVSNVRISFSDQHPAVISGDDGYWKSNGHWGNVTVSPSFEEWSFRPPYYTAAGYPWEAVNFRMTYDLSGRAIDRNGNGISGVAVWSSSGGYVTTGADGRWSLTGMPYPDVVSVKAEKDGYLFSPPIRTAGRPSRGVDFVGDPAATYRVSGTIMGPGGIGMNGVTIFLGGGFGTVISGSYGRWESGPIIGEVTVTPCAYNCTFSPATDTVNGPRTNVDFVTVGNAPLYSVSGSVVDSRDDRAGLPGVTLTFSGGFGRTLSEPSGAWGKYGLRGQVTITPSRPGWTFAPESYTVSGESNGITFRGTPTSTTASASAPASGGQVNVIKGGTSR